VKGGALLLKYNSAGGGGVCIIYVDNSLCFS
jgi:hypothetical protein